MSTLLGCTLLTVDALLFSAELNQSSVRPERVDSARLDRDVDCDGLLRFWERVGDDDKAISGRLAR